MALTIGERKYQAPRWRFRYINEVTLRRARLLLGWVTIGGCTALDVVSYPGQL